MAKQIVNIGTPDKGNGDPIRTAFDKINQNFTEVYNNLNTIEVEQDFDGGAAATVYDNETIFDGGGA